MKFFTLFYFIFFTCNILFAQIGGESTYQFLNLETSAKNAALGGKLVSDIQNDPIAGLFNPAAINVRMDKNYSLNYVNYLADISYGSAAAAFQIKDTQKVLHFGVIYADYGEFDGFDLSGNATGEFNASETAFSIGYATPIPNSNFHFGGNIKAISSKLEQYSSFGIAGDIGLIYFKENRNLTIGLAVRNIGAQITTFADTNENLPLEINLGISKTLEKAPLKWYLTLQNLQFWDLAFSNENRNTENLLGGETEIDDPSFFNNVLRHVNLGAEFFPEKALNIRVGYNFRRSEELKIIEQRTFAGFSAGFGLRIRKLKFNYSYVQYNSAGSASLFGLNLNFGEYK